MDSEIENVLAIRADILRKKYLNVKLSKRKEKDGSLTYQKFLDRVDAGEKEIPVRYFKKDSDLK